MKNTLRQFLFSAIIFLAAENLNAQNIFPANGSVGIGTVTPNSSAICEMNSTTQGLLVPRMLKIDRLNLPSPATGLLIYQTDYTKGFYYWDGANWIFMTTKYLNKNMNNLLPTAINESLVPDTNNTLDLGSAFLGWKNIYASGSYFIGGNKVVSSPGTGNIFLGATGNTTNTTGYYNTFVGFVAGHDNISGDFNTFVGRNSGYSNNYGNDNTAIGSYALGNNQTGNSNTALGSEALIGNIAGYGNTATGYQSLGNGGSGSNNTANGYQALINNYDGNSNTAIGAYSLQNNTSGNYNTAVGVQTILYTNNSDNNTALGYLAGANGTFGNSTFVGAQAMSTGALSNATAIGAFAITTASNQVRIGDAFVNSIGGNVNWTAVSDGRFKKNVKENVSGLEFIKRLRPVSYTLDVQAINNFLRPNQKPENENGITANGINEKEKIVYTGFIAQEVEQAAKEVYYDFSGVDAPKNEKDLYGLRYAEFVVPLVKAVQEQQKIIEELKAQVETLSNREALNPNSDADNSATGIDVLLSSKSIVLNQNEPNPFKENTVIEYFIPDDAGNVKIIFTDNKGSVIKEVEISEKGKGQLNVYASDLSSGIYNYTIVANGITIDSKKMLKTK